MSDVEDFTSFFIKLPKIHGNRKACFLTDNPSQVALLHLFSNKLNKMSFLPEVFSTVNAAVNYLSNPKINKEILDKIITEMKKTLHKMRS